MYPSKFSLTSPLVKENLETVHTRKFCLTSVENMAPFQQKRFVLGAAAALLLQAGHEIKKKKRKKRKWWHWWVRPWSSERQRGRKFI